MAQTGYTPIQLYYSTTAATAPLAASLANGELAINITDGKLYYKDNAAAVQVIGWKTVPTSAGGTGLTSYTAGDTLYYASGTTLSKLAIGAANTVLTSSGTAPQWSTNLNIGSLTATSISDSGNLTFTGTGNRITADTANATIANRFALQDSTVNAQTIFSVFPNGTGTTSQIQLYNGTDTTNYARFNIVTTSASMTLSQTIGGTGTYLPMTFNTGGVERVRILSTGNVLVTSAVGLGYGTGAGGTVTQATSRTTGVTLNKPTGTVTMFSAAGSIVAATFTVTNSLVAATDTIILNQQSGTNLYVFLVTAVAAGSFNITFYTTGGVATDAPVINFSLIKGVTA